MLGPHYEKLAEIENRLTAKQMLEKIKIRPENPLTRIVDKLKREFGQYETAYSDPIMDYQITSLDRILSFDSKLGPILDALEKQNQLLRKQLGIMQGQLSNTVGICEQILAENNELKLIVKGKNEDINKIIQTIASNQAQQMDELQQKNNMLLKQNSILMLHLEEIKKEHQRYSSIFRQKDDQINTYGIKIGEIKKQLGESMSREKELSRKVAALEQNLYQHSEDVYQLGLAKQSLTFQNNELKNQLTVIQQRGENGSYQTIKQQLESQYEPILEEHRLLKRERVQLIRQAEQLKLQKQKWQEIQSHLQQQVYKLSGDLQLTTSLLNEQKNKNAALNNNLSKIQNKLSELKDDNNRLLAEKETNSNYTMNREKRLLQEIDDLRKILEDKQGETEDRMREISKSMQGLLESKDMEIRNLRQENLQLQRLVQRRS